jgi:hypothetical protein
MDSQDYRRKASELRQRSAVAADAEMANQLRETARQYELWAAEAERRAQDPAAGQTRR